jgi:hypothetical protein
MPSGATTTMSDTPPTGAEAELTLSQRLAAAGYTRRDTRLKCDECGLLFTPQMLPIHKCTAPTELETVQHLRDALTQIVQLANDRVHDWDGVDRVIVDMVQIAQTALRKTGRPL